MANRNHTRDTLAPKNMEARDRFLTVLLYPEARRCTPWIKLCGHWLSQAGFTPRSRVRVRVMTGCLVITIEPGKVQSL